MDVVIPVARENFNETLPIALDSIARHAPHLRVVLAGETLPWAHLLRDSSSPVGGTIPVDQPPSRALWNTDRIMQLACQQPEVSDPFLWSNDDIYWRRPVDDAELALQSGTAWGSLRGHRNHGMYGRANHLTASELERQGLPIWSYERHVPLLVHKALMLETLGAIRLGTFSKRSLYGNRAYPTPLAVAEGIRDVKLFKITDPIPAVTREPFLSTGNEYPLSGLRTLLGLA